MQSKPQIVQQTAPRIVGKHRLAMALSCEGRVRSYCLDLADILNARTLTFVRPALALADKLRKHEIQRLETLAGRSVTITEHTTEAILITNDLSALTNREQTVLVPKGEKCFDRLGRQRFLVPIGQDDAGLRALACALPLAKAANATVVLYHTTWRKDGIASNDAWDHMTALSQAIAIQAVEAVTREEVNYELALEIEAPGVPEGIIRAANDRRANIIVMAYSSRNIRGSKAEVVAKKTNIPLLIAGNGFEAGTFPAPATTAKPPTNIAPPAPPPPAVSPWLGVKRVMAIAIALTVLKAVAKIWLGRSIGSSAIVADGAHSMSDAVPDLLVMWIALLAGRMANRSYPLGRGNLNTIITLGTGITLALVCLNVTWNITLALYHLATHQYTSSLKLGPQELPYAIIITLLSATISFAVGSYQVYAGKKTREPGVVADGAEMEGDGLIELATFGGLVGAYFFKAPWVEHLIAAFILYFVSGTAKEFLVDGINGLTQKSLGTEIEEEITKRSNTIHGVARVATLKTFAVGGTTAVIMLRIETIRNIETAIVQDAVRREISELFAKHEDFGRSEIWIEEAERSPTYRIAIAVSGSRVASRLSKAESVWICEVERDETISSVNAVALDALPLADRAALIERKKAHEVVTFFADDNDRAALETRNIALRTSATFFPGALLYS